MRRVLLVTLLAVLGLVPVLSSAGAHRSFAQSTSPVGDEFNNTSFTAPFQVRCGAQALQPCPDAQGPNTYSLDQVVPGFLRIITQPGSLLGVSSATQTTNNARNFVVQSVPASADYIVTTKLSFPGAGTFSSTALGQVAGLLVYQDDNNFIYFGRTLNSSVPNVQDQFVQEVNGVDIIENVPETGNFQPTIYLRLTKQGSVYRASFSYDNVNFVTVGTSLAPVSTSTPTASPTASPTITASATPLPTANATATSIASNTGYTADYVSPQVGVFAWGGLNAMTATSEIPADFDWFRVNNSSQPATTPTATATATATATGTPQPTAQPTSTTVPTATSVPATAVPATNTPIPTATTPPTSVPTPTAVPSPPRPHGKAAAFAYASIWYHEVRIGTNEHIQVQDRQHAREGIWVNVYFATGQHKDYFQNTDNSGFWAMNFTVPANTISRFSHTAVVTFQLWHGRATAMQFGTFTVIH